MIKTEHLSDSVTLYLGDSREILPTLSGVDCTVTSPPYNTGRTKNPSLDLIRRLADHFKVSVAWLVGEIPDEKSDNKAAALYRTLQSLSPQNQLHIQAIIDSMQKTGNE